MSRTPKEAINGYITDMLALEEHIVTAVQGQRENLKDEHPKFTAVMLGVGAAAIDLVRSERVPKNLRDDYTVIALATVGYAMLFTTATSLGDAPVAALAASQHKDYARASMQLSHVVPSSVLTLLTDEGLIADGSVLKAVNKELDANWRA